MSERFKTSFFRGRIGRSTGAFVIAPLAFALISTPLYLWADDAKPVGTASPSASASSSAAAGGSAKFRDLEKDPPTELGTELNAKDDWANEEQVAIRRPQFARTDKSWGSIVDGEACDVRVRSDWLRIRCEGTAGRVNQLSGDPRDTLIHLHSELIPDGKDGFIDQRRLLMYARMVPGRVTMFEVTTIESGYNSDWEGPTSMISIDWSDPDAGPRVLIQPINASYGL